MGTTRRNDSVTRSRAFFLAGALVVIALAAGFFLGMTHTLREPLPQIANSSLHLTSSGLDGDTIPGKFTCDGEKTPLNFLDLTAPRYPKLRPDRDRP
jgi:hypothetical protein